MARNQNVDWPAVTDVILRCENQACEDNRNVARMASLLAGLPIELPGSTVIRLCGSGMDAVGTAARAIMSGEARPRIAGGVESRSRAPFTMPKAESAFNCANVVHDTTIGWRFINKLMKERCGVDSMHEAAENVAAEFRIDRASQDRLALASQRKAFAAQQAGFFDVEITPVSVPQKNAEAIVVDRDEHPRETSFNALTRLKGVVRPGWHRDCWQLQRHQQRRMCAPARQRCRGDPERPHAAGTCCRRGNGRCGPAHHGLRPGTGHAQAAGAGGIDARSNRCDRTQRDLCRPGAWP